MQCGTGRPTRAPATTVVAAVVGLPLALATTSGWNFPSGLVVGNLCHGRDPASYTHSASYIAIQARPQALALTFLLLPAMQAAWSDVPRQYPHQPSACEVFAHGLLQTHASCSHPSPQLFWSGLSMSPQSRPRVAQRMPLINALLGQG